MQTKARGKESQRTIRASEKRTWRQINEKRRSCPAIAPRREKDRAQPRHAAKLARAQKGYAR